MLKMVRAGQVRREAHPLLLSLLSPSDAVLARGAMDKTDRERADMGRAGDATAHITKWSPESGLPMPPAPAKHSGGKPS